MLTSSHDTRLIDGAAVVALQLKCRELAWWFDGGRRETARSEVLTWVDADTADAKT